MSVPNNGRRHEGIPIRLSISVSPKMSEMSSTGRDSKVNMVVAVGGFPGD